MVVWALKKEKRNQVRFYHGEMHVKIHAKNITYYN